MPIEESDTEQKILEAAHRVFIQKGTAGARTQDIADAAGINKALLHYYFRTKEALAQAVFQRAARTFIPVLMHLFQAPIPLREKVEAVCTTYQTLLTENPYLPGYLLAEINHQPERITQFFASSGFAVPIVALQQHLDEEAAAGRIRPTLATDFLLAVMSLNVFPHAAKGLFGPLMGLPPDALSTLLAERSTRLPDHILRLFAP